MKYIMKGKKDLQHGFFLHIRQILSPKKRANDMRKNNRTILSSNK